MGVLDSRVLDSPEFVIGGCPRLSLPSTLAPFARKTEESFAAGDFAPTLSKGPDPRNNRAHGIAERTE